jgi:hypothetical protein
MVASGAYAKACFGLLDNMGAFWEAPIGRLVGFE